MLVKRPINLYNANAITPASKPIPAARKDISTMRNCAGSAILTSPACPPVAAIVAGGNPAFSVPFSVMPDCLSRHSPGLSFEPAAALSPLAWRVSELQPEQAPACEARLCDAARVRAIFFHSLESETEEPRAGHGLRGDAEHSRAQPAGLPARPHCDAESATAPPVPQFWDGFRWASLSKSALIDADEALNHAPGQPAR